MKMNQLALALATLGMVGAAATAHAEAEVKEKIEVTGSRIKRIAKETPSAVTVVTHEDIERSGKASVAEVLRSVSANSANSYNESYTNSFAPGASGISLRGLGQKSTLVLLNGRRVANFGFAQNLSDSFFDLNSIPASAIARVEILKDGASAIYGSDAIAGVVNIILRNDMEGVETSGSFGTSTEGGMNEYHASITGGYGNMAENHFNIMGSIDYLKRDSLKASDRKLTENQDFRDQFGGLDGWGQTGGTFRVDGSHRQAFASCPNGSVNTPASNFSNPYTKLFLQGDICAFNPAPYIELMPATERVNGFARGRIDFGAGIEGYSELLLSHVETKQSATPGGISNSGKGVRFDPVTGGLRLDDNTMPANNPANPFGKAMRFGYSFFDVGLRNSKIDSDSYRLLAGVRGSFHDWDWDMAAGTSQSKATNYQYNRINADEALKALAGAYDFLHPENSKAEADKLRLNLKRVSTSKLDFADVKLSGELFNLPAGAVGMATGLDWRRESIDDVPDDNLAGGRVLGQGATRTKGSRNEEAAFVEFNVPLLKTLEMSLAGREDHYSDFGSSFSPKVGFKWTPVKELMLRATYAEGFRAPTLAENAQSNSTFFANVTDKFHVDPTLRTVVQVAGTLNSNPALEAENSKSYSAGFVLEPSKNFNISVDFYKIRQNKLVQSDDLQYIEDHENDPRYKGAVLRDSVTGNILAISTSYHNVGFVDTKGVDIESSWQSAPTYAGRFSALLDTNYILSYRTQPAIDSPVDDYVGRGISAGIYPRMKAGLTLGNEYGAWTNSIKLNYTAPYSQEQTPAGSQDHVASSTTADWFLGYKYSKQLDMSFAVQNLFDRNPPFDAYYASSYGLPAAFTIYDMRGRYVRGTVNYKF